MDPNGRCIFRFDTHGEVIPFGAPCHLHLGETEEVVEPGDPRLHGFDFGKVNALVVLNLVHKILKNRKLPWQ